MLMRSLFYTLLYYSNDVFIVFSKFSSLRLFRWTVYLLLLSTIIIPTAINCFRNQPEIFEQIRTYYPVVFCSRRPDNRWRRTSARF